MRVSFIHPYDANMASYRYRSELPAHQLGVPLNDWTAELLIIGKPTVDVVQRVREAKAQGRHIVADFCDDHFDRPEYHTMLTLADRIICNTPVMAERIGRDALVIPDPYELPEVPPHGSGRRLFWFGHGSNLYSLHRILGTIPPYPLTVMTNKPWAVAWSKEALQAQFAQHDIVLMPATDPYKSANRTLEAIRQGCFVVAEPHPALDDIPGIWHGNIKEGIQWAVSHWDEANAWTKQAQDAIRERYAPITITAAWRSLCDPAKWPSMSAVETSNGPDGWGWTAQAQPCLSTVISDTLPSMTTV